jgi:hypothetical protein
MKRLLIHCAAGLLGVIIGIVVRQKVDAADAEYILLIVEGSDPDSNAIGSVQVGLNKVQAEGAAFQLNETLKEHEIPLVVKARKQIVVRQRRGK